MTRRGLFLDRDGVVNDLVFYSTHGEWEAPRNVADLRIRPGVPEAIRHAADQGFLVFLITNQPSFAKGKCSLEDLQQVHAEVLSRLAAAGALITDSYVCYHHPQSTLAGFGQCECRKPSPFFIRQAAEAYSLEMSESWMAGDQETDIEAGRRAGCRTALLKYEHSHAKRGSSQPDLVCDDLEDLVRRIERP